MKKIIICFIFLLTLLIGCNTNIINKCNVSLTDEEMLFIKNNNIDYENLKKYLPYKYFILNNYFLYEKLRCHYKCSHIEAINHYNNPNYYNFYIKPKKSIFINSNIMLVNKCFYLDSSYIPNDLININNYNVDYIKRTNEIIYLNKEALEKYYLMYQDAQLNNIELVIFSGYRSYQKQVILYYDINNMNDSISAKPGFSEHQSGYALDISTRNDGLTNYFKNSLSYNWLINNSYKYGFILRYPEEKEIYTGYNYEPWHFRYVGIKVANDINNNYYCLEEYIIKNIELNF